MYQCPQLIHSSVGKGDSHIIKNALQTDCLYSI